MRSYNVAVHRSIRGDAAPDGLEGGGHVVSERIIYDDLPAIAPAPWIDPAAIEVRALTTSDTPAFRALRLEALRLHPESFVPTYEEERDADGRSIAARFRDDWIHNGNFILGAYRQGWLVGAVGVKRWPRQKQRHKATIWIMYTQEDFRGLGAGRMLLDAAIDRCRQDHEIELVHLSVSRDSLAARNLYASTGFRSYGVEPRALKLGPDHYVDVEEMVLDVKNVDYQISAGWHETNTDCVVAD
ncbi:MAG: GNAT family N-acetyltransferase [Thermomicrobiales bacterium]|nr:GNAT family N-acetyltransferase [Thermomicrobiales bacterium]